MSDTPPCEGQSAKPDIAHVRREIDRVDTALLGLIAERLDLAAEVRRSKSGVGVWRPSREESHVRDLATRAGDTPPALVSTIMAELMSASLALQGPMRLHIALEGDALSAWSLVRDRFGAALPTVSYPTASAALGAAASEPEAVAVVGAPGGMTRWWTALCRGGAMENLHILAALPRTGSWEWPDAVAVADSHIAPSGADRSLITVLSREADRLKAALSGLHLQTDSGPHELYVSAQYIAPDDTRLAAIASAKVIGVLPLPIGRTP